MSVDDKAGRATAVSEKAESSYLCRMPDETALVNLGGDYDYLSRAYYISQDVENSGELVRPTCKEMIDAYVPPLFLEKAQLAGLEVPEYYISNGLFEAPAIVDPVNPFTLKGRTAMKPSRVKSIAKSLTRNYTYAVCCRPLPEESKIIRFRSILGWSLQAQYREASQVIWNVFSVPLGIVRLIQTKDGKLLFSDISPLPFEELSKREKKYIEERVSWVS